MKKILVLLVSILCVCSCGFNKTPDKSITTTSEYIGIGYRHLYLMDVEFNGEKHEYVFFHSGSGRSLSHWEGCKYCKEKNNHN